MSHDFFRLSIKNMLTSRMLYIFLAMCIFFGCIQQASGGMFDKILYYQFGVPYFFLVEMDLREIMLWSSPHIMLSILIGQNAETMSAVGRYAIPRYTSIYRNFLNDCFLSYFLVAFYYILMYFSVIVFTWLGGARSWELLPIISETVPACSWSYILKMLCVSIFTMSALTTMQNAVYLLTKSCAASCGALLMIIFVSIFLPIPSIAKYAIGNWLMPVRSMEFVDKGYRIEHVLIGCSICILVAYACVRYTTAKLSNKW